MSAPLPARRLPGRFWAYFAGQTASNFGSAFTAFALPLLVLRVTGSASQLGAATAVTFLPWLLFGLLGGAVMDRVDRKRVMVGTDLARAAVVCLLPGLAAGGDLRLGWIYAVMFVQSCLQVVFSGGTASAVVALVDGEDLIAANSALSASTSASSVAGSALAGVLAAVVPLPDVLWVDGASFLVSAASLAAIRTTFNLEPPLGLAHGGWRRALRSLLAETRTGVAYVWHQPVLRALSLQLAAVSLFSSVAMSQLPLIATRRLGADNAGIGYLHAASACGVLLLSLIVSRLRHRLRLGPMILIALTVYGLGIAAFGLTTSYVLGLLVWGCVGAATVLYNVSTATLRQQIVPNELLGRVGNVAIATGWCTIPIASLAGGAVIAATHRVDLVYLIAGIAIVTLALGFNRAGLRHADHKGRRA